ncbi:MAG: glycoside hydrolase family 130 protein [Candidatus Azobacteroides sp.]|nr:glycoside hydrolase family 130 protein [Candidatus Azobacteroides sp.]
MKNISFGLLSIILVSVFICFSCVTNKEHNSDRNFPDWAWTDFQRSDGINPVISPDPATLFYCPVAQDTIDWESNDTFNPGVAVRDNRIVLLYRAEDRSGKEISKRISRLGYAFSDDGLSFQRKLTPVFYPDNDFMRELEFPGGCEDPRIAVTEDGMYVMTYTAWNQDKARLCVATSPDLEQWTKHGPVFAAAHGGKFRDTWSKAGSIITKIVDGKQVIAKIKGKYWMYWGEFSTNVAVSDDLINWEPILDETGELKISLAPRPGKFDSQLVEPGPPAIVTEHGILLFYNGKNKPGEEGDTEYIPHVYCAGQALFDIQDPTKLIDRLDKPFFVPESDFEKSGQYPDGTVFIEGMAFFNNKWFLYYGCADSRVGVAVYSPGSL